MKVVTSTSLMLKDLGNIQQNLMLNLVDNSLRMQETIVQDHNQNQALEQELCWAQKSHQNWIQFNKTKYFQIAATIKEGKILLAKSWMNMWFGQRRKCYFVGFLMNLLVESRRTQMQLIIRRFLYLEIYLYWIMCD